MREIVFDTETTGLDPAEGHRITEIGCLEVINRVPTGENFHRYINPERDVPDEVVKITGLTTAFLKDKPRFSQVADDFLNFVGDAALVAHNASFDAKFINAELTRLGHRPFGPERFIDTLQIARKRFPGAYNSLDALCKRYNISLDDRNYHGALIDARLLAEVYLELHGGREQGLDLEEAKDLNCSDQKVRSYGPRPVPFVMPITDEEQRLHAALIDEMGENALWKKVS
jgi:DNA polymerase III subunit epsilon